MAALRARLPDGRLHLQHGPIDLVIQAWGPAEQIEGAYAQAWERFQDILERLVSELELLRSPVGEAYPLARGPVARRMVAAVWPHRTAFITPMAAVAGAVADEMLAAMRSGLALAKACVNDGGDIAVHLLPGERLDAGIVNDLHRPRIDSSLRIDSPCGIATSGWRGRSQSLGIADAVTVLARNAAAADAAATLIANAVNAEDPAIRRLPAQVVKADSDLGNRLVTVEVGPLPDAVIRHALRDGLETAARMAAEGHIEAAYLALQGSNAVCAAPCLERAANAFTLPRS
jgi:ApbE superfamily uncharacterized protein (UPF0280 family)